MALRFTFEGDTFDTGSLLVREVEALETRLGVRYIELRPMASMRDKLAIMATFLLRTRSEEDVAKILNDITVDAVETMWDVAPADDLPEFYQDGMPDPKAAGSATPG